MARVAGGASNLEFDEVSGRRGDRDAHLEAQLCRLTGAEAATVVNNNAAAVMLVLNSLALRKEVPVSRGELIEIGGAFRIPDIMARAGAKLCEVGTTNRTHLKDFAEAIGPRTALIMKVHTSNYMILGFSAAVPEVALAGLAREHGIPFVVDLGSGMLVDMAQYGLPHETTAAETLANGADLATFSGDKLLGGPQAGIIVGRADLIERIKRNPMKRALRVDKMTIAALAAVLGLYANPDRLAERLPVLRLLAARSVNSRPLAKRLIPFIAKHLGDAFTIEPAPCQSQIGSGALPVELLDSVALVIRSRSQRGSGKALERLASAFRVLPIPVIGRVQDDSLQFDLRCLEDERGFTVQLGALSTEPGKGRRGGRWIVATAGHIDHGKTLLVKALTGIDTDRLPEEKRRGHLHRPRLCLSSAGRRRDSRFSSTCRATRSSSTTCLPESPESIARCWWSPPMTGPCHRRSST